MSAKERAVIEAQLTGAPKIEADAKKINRALGDTKKAAGEGIAAGVNKATAGLQVMGAKADALRSAISPTTIFGGLLGGIAVAGLDRIRDYLGEAADAARAFGDRTSQTARRAGMDVGALRASISGAGAATLQSADDQMDFVDAVNQLTYGGKGAAKSLKTVGDVATVLGRSDRDMAPLIASLQTIQGLNADVGAGLKSMVETANQLRLAGGPTQLADALADLKPLLDSLAPSGKAKELKGELTAYQHLLMKQGWSKEQATAKTGGLVSFIEGHAGEIARTPGIKAKYTDIIDPETGRLKNLSSIWGELQKWAKKIPEARRAELLGTNQGAAALPLLMGSISAADVEKQAAWEAHPDRQKEAEARIAEERRRHLESPEGQREERGKRSGEIGRQMGQGWAELGDLLDRAKLGLMEELVRSPFQPRGDGDLAPGANQAGLMKALDDNTRALDANTKATQGQAPGQTLSSEPVPPGMVRW